MKKIISAIAIGAAFFTACSSETEELTNSNATSSTKKEITFEPYVETMHSRASEGVTKQNITDRTIYVYGYKVPTTDYATTTNKWVEVYDGAELTYNQTKQKWECNKIAFWEDGYTYKFFACAGQKMTNMDANNNKNAHTKISMENVSAIKELSPENEILMSSLPIDDTSSWIMTGPSTTDKGNVPITLERKQTWLTFKAYTTCEGYEIKIKSMKLIAPKCEDLIIWEYFHEKSGKTAYRWTSYTNDTNAGTATTWDSTTMTAHQELDLFKETTLGVGQANATAAEKEYLVLPYANGSSVTYYINVTYTVGDSSEITKLVNIPSLSNIGSNNTANTGTYKFQNNHLTLYLDIEPNLIEPYVGTMTNWGDGDSSTTEVK